MAVYTHVPAEALARFLEGYDHGTLISAKGIAEGVENSNFLVDTTDGRFILTVYEKRVRVDDLPFVFAVIDRLAERRMPVPRALPDRGGGVLQTLMGKPACLIEYLPGVSLSDPTPTQASAAGHALGRSHVALDGFAPVRVNTLGIDGWRPLLERCGRALDDIDAGLFDRVAAALDIVERDWPRALPTGAIHADLFPDNVLMLGDRITGLIDFYFACTDLVAYDLAVMHSAWAFDDRGDPLPPAIGRSLVEGYARARPIADDERIALPLLAQGACIRFLLTRAWDWLNTPADALVTRKDPLAYARRLDFYRKAGHAPFA